MDNKGTIVLGIGNSILGDDGIGLVVVDILRKRMKAPIHFMVTEEMGFGLMDFLIGYDRAIIVDSFKTGCCPPGSIHVIPVDEFVPRESRSNHYVGLPELSAMAKRLHMEFPEITLIGVEVYDPFTISTGLSSLLEEKLDDILDQVEFEIKKLTEPDYA